MIPEKASSVAFRSEEGSTVSSTSGETDFGRGNVYLRGNRYCCWGWLTGTSRRTRTQTIKKPATSNASPALISFPMTPPWSSSWLMPCVRNELRKKMDCRAKSKKLYHTSAQLKKKVSSGTKTCVMREVAYWLTFKRGICVITAKHHNPHKSYSTKMKQVSFLEPVRESPIILPTPLLAATTF